MRVLGVSVFMLVRKQLARQFDTVPPCYGKHGALRETTVDHALDISDLPILYIC